MSGGPFDGKAVLTGAGKSQVGRRLGRTGLDLTLEAVLRAIEDAGLSVDDVDGIASYPGRGVPDRGLLRRQPSPRCATRWGCARRWYMSATGDRGPDRPGDRGVHGRHPRLGQPRGGVPIGVGVDRGAAGRRRQASVLFGGGDLPPHLEWMAPFGALSAANWLAMPAQRYMHDFGLTREQLGRIAINARTNAGLNPDAVYREPMTMDDYLGARMISEPLCLYDCDVPCDGATAVIVSRRDAAERPAAAPVDRGVGGAGNVRTCHVGSALRHHHDGRPRFGRHAVGEHDTDSRATSTWPSCTTASPS